MIHKLTDADDQTKACTLCVHFRSYRDIYETDYEDDDCGRCSVNKDKDGTSYASFDHTCEKFEGGARRLEARMEPLKADREAAIAALKEIAERFEDIGAGAIARAALKRFGIVVEQEPSD